jgi:hypothetical protein
LKEVILGLDPGVTGAYAFYWVDEDRLHADDIPVANKNVNAPSLAKAIAAARPTVAIIELVSAMPKQGVSSTFKFGVAYGIAQGIIAAQNIPIHFVTPAKWKKHFNLSADKEISRARALRLWPCYSELFQRKKDHGRAEAALLTRYFMETLHNLEKQPLTSFF